MVTENGDRKPFNFGGLNGDLCIRLGADPEVVALGDRGIVKVRGASTHIVRGQGENKGKDTERTKWWYCDFWCNLDDKGNPVGPARSIVDRFQKGMTITLFGKYEPRFYVDKQGVEQEQMGFIANRINFGNEQVLVEGTSGVGEEEEEEVVSRRPSRAPAGRSSAGAATGRRKPSTDYEWEE